MTISWTVTNAPTGNWTGLQSPWGFVYGIVVDINLDGYQDLIAFEGDFPEYPTEAPPADTSYPLHFYINDGTGHLVDETASFFSGTIPETTQPNTVIIDDFNGDGLPDIFAGDNGWDGDPQTGAENLLLLSNSDGTFTNASANIPSMARTSYTVAAGDIDGDGDIDMFDCATGFKEDGNGSWLFPIVLLNDGSGNFTERLDLVPDLLTATYDAGLGQFQRENVFYISEMADLNADGKADLLLGQQNNEGFQGVVIYWSQGAAGYSDDFRTELSQQPFSDNTEYTDIQVFDANGDGHLDIISNSTDGTNGLGFYLTLSLGDGQGGFANVTSTSFFTATAGSGITGVAIGELRLVDFDLDGDIDIVGLPKGDFVPQMRPILWLNNGQGVFDTEIYWSNIQNQTAQFGYPTDIILSADGDGYDFINYAAGEFDKTVGNYSTWSINNTSLFSRVIYGDDGFNLITGGAGNETVYSLGGKDIVHGNNGADILYGGTDDDILNGGAGSDQLFGGDDNDTLNGGTGVDTVDGGDGIDTLDLSGATNTQKVNLVTNVNIGGFAHNDTFLNIENVIGSATRGDDITGTAGSNTLSGLGADDILRGFNGDDILEGGDNNDYLYGGRGADVLDGGNGNDWAMYNDSSHGVIVDLGGVGSGGIYSDGDTYISIERVRGSDFADSITMDGASNKVLAGDGDDTIFGMGGKDSLRGGNDNDRINGGTGNDTMFGDAGADIFEFDLGNDADWVADFENDIDTIELDGNLAGGAIAGMTIADIVTTYGNQINANRIDLDFGNGDVLKILATGITAADLYDDISVV